MFLTSSSNALVLIPCCKSKDISDSSLGNSLSLQNIAPMRKAIIDFIRQSHYLSARPNNEMGILDAQSSANEAIRMYTGRFFKVVATSLDDVNSGKHPSVHVLIVSALYGLVRLNEDIKLYDLTMGDILPNGDSVYEFWRKKRLSDVLINYIEHNDIGYIWSLLPHSVPMFPYHQVFQDAWEKLRGSAVQTQHVLIQGAGLETGHRRASWLQTVMLHKPDHLNGMEWSSIELQRVVGFRVRYARC